MKTKILSALLAIVMLTTLTACGGSSTGQGGESSGSTPSNELTPTDEILEPFSTTETLDETVMVDEGGVTITATGLTYTAYSVDLELTIENNSGKDLSFVSGSLGYSCNSVNGYMVKDGYLNCDVANGKKANESISFGYDALMLYGIHEIADLEIGISMTDDDYNTTYTGPRQLKTSAFDAYDYGTDHYQETITSETAMNTYGYEMKYFSKDPLYDQNGVKLLSSGLMTNQDGGIALLLELENTTDSMVYLSTADIALNGLLLNSSTWSSDAINPGKRGIVTVELSAVFDPAYWGVYGITDVESVSLSLGQRNEKGMEIAAETSVKIVLTDENIALDSSGTEVYNNNGLRIITKTVKEDASDYGADLYVLLLAENHSGKTLTIGDVYDSLSVNGVMTDYSYYSQELGDGASAALVVKLWESSLEENQITSPADIQEIEVSFEIKDGYTAIDAPTLTLTFEK